MFLIRQTEAYNSLYYWPHGKLYFIFKISLRKQRTLVKNKNLQYILFRVKSVIKLKFLSQVKTAISVIWPQIIGFVDICFKVTVQFPIHVFLSWNLMLLRLELQGELMWRVRSHEIYLVFCKKYHGDGHSNLEFLNNQRVCLKKLTNRNFN